MFRSFTNFARSLPVSPLPESPPPLDIQPHLSSFFSFSFFPPPDADRLFHQQSTFPNTRPHHDASPISPTKETYIQLQPWVTYVRAPLLPPRFTPSRRGNPLMWRVSCREPRHSRSASATRRMGRRPSRS